MNQFEEMYNMQHGLNLIIGRDTINDPDKEKWTFDYIQALEDEIVELKNCVNWKWWTKESKDHGQYNIIISLENAKIEVIDCFHFIISLHHILGLKYKFKYDFEIPTGEIIGIDIEEAGKIKYKRNKTIPSKDLFVLTEILLNITSSMKECTDCLTNGTFVDVKIIDKVNLENDLIYITDLMFVVCAALDMSIDDVYAIYKLKHQKNISRQENNYSVLNKTEDDNNEIIEKIKK